MSKEKRKRGISLSHQISCKPNYTPIRQLDNSHTQPKKVYYSPPKQLPQPLPFHSYLLPQNYVNHIRYSQPQFKPIQAHPVIKYNQPPHEHIVHAPTNFHNSQSKRSPVNFSYNQIKMPANITPFQTKIENKKTNLTLGSKSVQQTKPPQIKQEDKQTNQKKKVRANRLIQIQNRLEQLTKRIKLQ